MALYQQRMYLEAAGSRRGWLPGRLGGEPVRNLRYFKALLREVEQERIPEDCWRHQGFNLGRCEE